MKSPLYIFTLATLTLFPVAVGASTTTDALAEAANAQAYADELVAAVQAGELESGSNAMSSTNDATESVTCDEPGESYESTSTENGSTISVSCSTSGGTSETTSTTSGSSTAVVSDMYDESFDGTEADYPATKTAQATPQTEPTNEPAATTTQEPTGRTLPPAVTQAMGEKPAVTQKTINRMSNFLLLSLIVLLGNTILLFVLLYLSFHRNGARTTNPTQRF